MQGKQGMEACFFLVVTYMRWTNKVFSFQNIDNSSISADGSIDSSSISADESFNSDSPDRGTYNRALEIESMDTRKKPADPGKMIIFETWGQLLVMVPFTVAITLFGASWANEREYIVPGFFPNSQTFFLITTLNFYVSIIGIVVGHVSPTFARGFHLIAFFCALISLTMLFEALLPNELSAVPWIFLALVISILCGLVIYDWYFMPIENNPHGQNEEVVAPNGS